MTVTRPEAGEYPPYYEPYIALVEGTDLLDNLESQRRQMLHLLASRDDSQANFRYAPGKWTVKEVLGHICDAERVFAYRTLRIARGDQTPLSGFDENEYAANSPAAQLSLAELLDDYIAVRNATLTLLRTFDDSIWTRRGTANNFAVSVRALGYIIAGHDRHHQRILRQKYFVAP